jgi:hypothetical protein
MEEVFVSKAHRSKKTLDPSNAEVQNAERCSVNKIGCTTQTASNERIFAKEKA